MGIPIYEIDDFKFEIREIIDNVSKTFSLLNRKQEDNFKEGIKLSCRKYIKEKTGKRPLININLLRV